MNGETVVAKEKGLSFSEFSKTVYKESGIAYPKFFKMDNLSKLTFLTAEVLLKNCALPSEEKEKMALVLSNRSASLDTDRKHQLSIQSKENFYPSPAVFVYTLPNIGMGEISIRHQIKGENAFFVFKEFNAKFLMQYSEALIHNKKASHVLCGWVDIEEDAYRSFMYLVSKRGTYIHSEAIINKEYQNI
ncbi:beta-ketoacyl-[acyl-carrier-protein] synthase family protein [Cochleicola gelatinilyticus]|uniref:3-oxoacyl-ACP synthase n=1 Tax=Cochleicola gelatinilyticus TaxID=1763537 RepID=UPI001F525604|nr:3-oxoacyl-ACP synthase [Cochleicola gelatinilyticus]